jgi:hypothetical protein
MLRRLVKLRRLFERKVANLDASILQKIKPPDCSEGLATVLGTSARQIV